MRKQDKSLLIKGGKVVDPANGIEEARDLLLEDGLIAAVEKPGEISPASGVEVIDASGCTVTPGLVDIHVHLREPGQEWKEDIASGTSAAVAGGFTTVCCMPNTKPVNDSAAVTEFVLEQARLAGCCRVLPIGAISVGSKGESLSPMMELRDAGCVAFSDDGSPVSDAGLMRKALEYSLMVGGVLTVHEEDTSLSHGFSMNESALSLRLGLQGMPGAAEDVMIARDIELSRLTGARVHFCHVSTARAVTLIRRAKEDGIPVTAEVTPHHLLLDETSVEGYDTQAKMSMPLRSREDVDALIAGLADGTIDCVASDHAPHEDDSKTIEFDKASFGILGLQTTLPLVLGLVRDGKLPFKRAIESLTSSPSACFGLDSGSLSKGAKADLTVISEDKRFVLSKDDICSKSFNTPFMGDELQGAAQFTIVGGNIVYQEGV